MKTRRRDGGWEKGPGHPAIFSDFDGTITEVDVTDQVLRRFAHPSWQEVEREWVRGVMGSRECLERQMALVSASPAEFNALVDAIPLDRDFQAFQAFLAKRRIPFYIVSDGFDYIIRRVLKRTGFAGSLRSGTRLFASGLRFAGRRLELSFPYSAPPCEHGCATCKAEVLRRVGKGRKPIVFIGDGFSDRFAVEEADVVFAKGNLLAYCRERGIACRPFETFGDIERAMKKMPGFGDSGRARQVLAAVG